MCYKLQPSQKGHAVPLQPYNQSVRSIDYVLEKRVAFYPGSPFSDWDLLRKSGSVQLDPG